MPRQKKTKKVKEKFLKVPLPEKMVLEADTLLQSRGSSVANFLVLQLMTFNRVNTIMGLEDPINFGKYTGVKVEAIIRADPQYMIWCVKQSNCRNRFDMEVVNLITEIAQDVCADPREIPF